MPPPAWLIDDVLATASLAVLYGKPGSGKSFLALDWALCVAAGVPWNAREVRGGPVLYVAAEGIGGMGVRLRAWTETFNIPEPDAIHFYPGSISLLETERRIGLIELAQRLNPTLVVFDTLARSIVGGDENSAKDVGVAIDTADAVKSETGATVLLIHHTTKSGDSYRGNSSLEGAADTMVLVEAEDATLTVKCDKAKDADRFEPIKLTRAIVTLSDGYLTSCVLRSHSPSGNDLERADSEKAILDVMWELFGTTGASSKALHDHVKLPSSTFYRARNVLLERGELLNCGTLKQPFYKLPRRLSVPQSHPIPTPDGNPGDHSHPLGGSFRAPSVGITENGPSEREGEVL